MQVLGFTDNLNILDNSLNYIKRAAQVLIQATNKATLKVKTENTKLMKLLDNEDSTDDDDDDEEDEVFEKVNEFQYLGAILSVKNDWLREIRVRVIKTERTSIVLSF